MAETLPYMQSTGLVSKILAKIKDAKTPDRFSQDYLASVLGFSGGSAKPFISLLKRIGFLGTDGSPTSLYKRYRGTPEESGAAMAEGLRKGYVALYKRNEYVHALDKNKLEGLVKEVTGHESQSSTLRAIVGTFIALKELADFEAPRQDGAGDPGTDHDGDEEDSGERHDQGTGALRFGYTINVNLPATSDIAVFNAIFKSMKENLL